MVLICRYNVRSVSDDSHTFCVVFPDSIIGAIALHDFADMPRLRFGRTVELHLYTDLIPVHSCPIDDVLAAIHDQLDYPQS